MGARVLIPFLILSNGAVLAGMVKTMGTEAQASTAAAPADSEDDPDCHFPLQMLVRVPSEEGEHYVRTAFELLIHPRDRDVFMANLPKIRDAVLRYYVDRRLEDLTGSAGIARTKRAILERVQAIAKRPVRAIFLVAFVVT